MAGANPSSTQFRVAVIIVGAVVFAACTAFSVFGLRALKTEKAEIDRIDDDIKTAEQKIAQRGKLNAELEVLRREFEIDRKILPEEAEVEQFIDSLYQSRAVPGIPPGTVSPIKGQSTGKEAEQKPFEQKAWTLRFTADYYQTAEFMNAIESHQRFIQVDSFDVRAGDFDPNTTLMDTIKNDVNMTISTFIYVSRTPSKAATK